MSDYSLSVASGTGPVKHVMQQRGSFGGVWVLRGTLTVNGIEQNADEGKFLCSGDIIDVGGTEITYWVRFHLSREMECDDAALSCVVQLPEQPNPREVLLRMDEVKFPSGAVAYRHVHPGDGIRFLTAGELQIIGDEHTETATPGHAWFEPAHSPVRAQASLNHQMTSFLRFMILPGAFQGKPTITFQDKEDALRPRRQITRRYFDEIVQLDDG